MSIRADAQDEKFRSERPNRRPARKSGRKHVKPYLRAVQPVDEMPAPTHADTIIANWVAEGSL